MKKNLLNEHEIKEYFCDQMANNWEKINKNLIQNKYVLDSAINFHAKLMKKDISAKSQKYWDLIDRFIYKNHKEELNKFFLMKN